MAGLLTESLGSGLELGAGAGSELGAGSVVGAAGSAVMDADVTSLLAMADVVVLAVGEAAAEVAGIAVGSGTDPLKEQPVKARLARAVSPIKRRRFIGVLSVRVVMRLVQVDSTA